MRATLEQLAADPEVRAAIARQSRLPVVKESKPHYITRMKQVGPTIDDLVRRVLALEAKLRDREGDRR